MSTFDDEKRMQPSMDTWYKYTFRDRGSFVVDRSVSCKKYDLVLRFSHGKNVSIEEKFNFTDIQYDQLIVEIIQDLVRADLGWFYHLRCDQLIWTYCPISRSDPPVSIYKINWKAFKPYVFQLLKREKWHRFNIVKEGYGLTLNFPVKWQPLLDGKIATHYSVNKEIFDHPLIRIQAHQLFAAGKTVKQVSDELRLPLVIARKWQPQIQESYVEMNKRIYAEMVNEGWIPPPTGEADPLLFRDEMNKRVKEAQSSFSVIN